MDSGLVVLNQIMHAFEYEGVRITFFNNGDEGKPVTFAPVANMIPREVNRPVDRSRGVYTNSATFFESVLLSVFAFEDVF